MGLVAILARWKFLIRVVNMGQDYESQFPSAIATLSDSRILDGLRGIYSKFDTYLNLVGPDDLASILKDGLPVIFERQPDLLVRARDILAPLSNIEFKHWDETSKLSLSLFLAELIRNDRELLRELGGTLTRAVWKGIARSRRQGESTRWTEIEDRAHELLLGAEYAGIESEIFNRLKEKLRANSDQNIAGVTKSSQSNIDLKRRVSEENAETELLSWSEMQAMVRSIDPSLLGDIWQKEPRKTLHWLLSNGTQEQLFTYLYKNADQLDDDIKKIFLNALAEDEFEQVPLVWKTVLVRALSGRQSD